MGATDSLTHIVPALAIVDTRDGNSFEIYKVYHDGVNVTDLVVSDACLSAAILMDDITASVPAAQETTTSAGITVRNQTSGAAGVHFGGANPAVWATSDGMKQITIAASVVAGWYFVVARFSGSGGSVPKTLDY